MSNVEYRCPHYEDDPPCPGKLFAPPGGTKLKCRHHDVVYIQRENPSGPDFFYVDEKGKTQTKDKIGPHNERVVEEPPIPSEAELIAHRDMYENLTGLEVDKRWGVPRIKDEIAAHFGTTQTSPEVEGREESEDGPDDTVDPTTGDPSDPGDSTEGVNETD